MLITFINFAKHSITSRPLIATAATFTGGLMSGSLLTAYYKNQSIKVLEEKLEQKAFEKLPADNSYAGQIKRTLRVVTDESVNYVEKTINNNFFSKVSNKVAKELASIPDKSEDRLNKPTK